jgi:hypothetical protein
MESSLSLQILPRSNEKPHSQMFKYTNVLKLDCSISLLKLMCSDYSRMNDRGVNGGWGEGPPFTLRAHSFPLQRGIWL